jgi:hypothetical protein
MLLGLLYQDFEHVKAMNDISNPIYQDMMNLFCSLKKGIEV